MSSVYGAGQADNHIENTFGSQANANLAAVGETVQVDSLTQNRQVMEAYLRKEYADTPILVDIARCESEYRQYDNKGQVVRGRVDRNDVGVMQINERYHLDRAKALGFDLYTVQGNIDYAKALYAKEGSKPWNASAKCWSVGNTVAKK